ncbi:hypothetical protein [Streptomyces sp. NPDC054865]
MVLTRRPIAEFMPVEWATAPGRSVLQGDKDDCAAAGFLKIDILGLGVIAAIHTACDLITEHHGERYDLANIPPDDPQVYAMIARMDTIGVFQVESRAQISMLPRLKPKTFQDLVIAVSPIRPAILFPHWLCPSQVMSRRRELDRVLCGEASLTSVWGGVLGVGLFRTDCGRSRSR